MLTFFSFHSFSLTFHTQHFHFEPAHTSANVSPLWPIQTLQTLALSVGVWRALPNIIIARKIILANYFMGNWLDSSSSSSCQSLADCRKLFVQSGELTVVVLAGKPTIEPTIVTSSISLSLTHIFPTGTQCRRLSALFLFYNFAPRMTLNSAMKKSDDGDSSEKKHTQKRRKSRWKVALWN